MKHTSPEHNLKLHSSNSPRWLTQKRILFSKSRISKNTLKPMRDAPIYEEEIRAQQRLAPAGWKCFNFYLKDLNVNWDVNLEPTVGCFFDFCIEYHKIKHGVFFFSWSIFVALISLITCISCLMPFVALWNEYSICHNEKLTCRLIWSP